VKAPELTPEQLRRERLRREVEWYQSEEGFLDFVRDSGCAPDAQHKPHGEGAHEILNWKSEPDPEAPGQVIYIYKMVLWPRSSFKSTVFDIGLVCWEIARNPNIRILVASETGKQAREFVEKAKEIIDSPWFRERSGIHRGTNWKQGSFKSALRTRSDIKEPTLQASGVGEVRTGWHWDLVIMDDVCSQENTKTPESIETLFYWFGETLAQLDPGCRLLVIGTLHHYADIYCRVQKTPEMAALFEFSIHAWADPVIDPNSDKPTTLFFPGRLTRKFVAQQKALMPPRLYACFYENKPAAEEDQIFLPEYFHIIEDQDIPPSVWSYILTDFAFTGGEKGKDRNDRTVFWVISFDCHRVAYVRDIIFGRWKPSDSVRVLCQVWDQWHPIIALKGITIEKTTHREMMQSLFEEVRRDTMIRPKIIQIEGRSQEIKDMRIEASEPRYRRGDIYFARSLREQHKKWNGMIDEMTEWPFSKHDDIPDAQSDMDKKDQTGKFYCPGPPVGYRVPVQGRYQPPMVDGKYNPEVTYDPRSLIRMMQQRAKGDLWSKASNTPQDNFFRRPPQQPKKFDGS
jgi:hypothetical protein